MEVKKVEEDVQVRDDTSVVSAMGVGDNQVSMLEKTIQDMFSAIAQDNQFNS